MIKVSVLYPNTAGCKFNMDYYLTQHMPMVQQKLGPACKRMAVDEGIAGGAPGAPATYVAMGHLYFDLATPFRTLSLRTRRRSWPTFQTTRHPAGHSDQRGQDVTPLPLASLRSSDCRAHLALTP